MRLKPVILLVLAAVGIYFAVRKGAGKDGSPFDLPASYVAGKSEEAIRQEQIAKQKAEIEARLRASQGGTIMQRIAAATSANLANATIGNSGINTFTVASPQLPVDFYSTISQYANNM